MRPRRDAGPSATGWTASSGNGESSMSARVATEARSPRVVGHSRLRGGRNGRRERGSQDKIAEWKPTRPRGRPSAVLLRPAHTLSRTSFCENSGNNRSNGPGKTAQLDQQAFHDEQRRPAEASNHHLGFPGEPTVLKLIRNPRLSLRALCCPSRPLSGGGPGNCQSSRICLYLRVFLVKSNVSATRSMNSSRVKYQRSFILSEPTLPSTNARRAA